MRVLFFILLCSVSLRAAPVSFRAEIAPILRAQCQSCHGVKDAKGDFRVASYAELMRALKGEPARVLRGNANDSLLHQLLVTLDKSDRMPRKSEPLTAQQIALIKRWIDEGAKFDGGDPKALLVQVIPRVCMRRHQKNIRAIFPSPRWRSHRMPPNSRWAVCGKSRSGTWLTAN